MPTSPFRHFWLSQDQPSEVVGELDRGPPAVAGQGGCWGVITLQARKSPASDCTARSAPRVEKAAWGARPVEPEDPNEPLPRRSLLSVPSHQVSIAQTPSF